MQRREFLKSALVAAAVSSEWPRYAWTQQTRQNMNPEEVKRVLVVFKCHLDIGFTDTQANVMRTYFERFYPQAIATARKLRESEAKQPYIWTTSSWLLYEYLEQAKGDALKQAEKAIDSGDLAWHALPFSWQSELLDRSAVQGCLGFSLSLDKRFGRKTIAGKMTDVPGHTRGIVPVLADNGIQLLDVGVNPASTPPDVPDAFLWKDPHGSSLAVIYHKHSYGGIIQIPRSDLAIDIEVHSDNMGPHTENEIREIYSKVKRRFPNAEITAANLSDVANALKPETSKLPVFTQEIGDTWIYGAPSDPPKIARYREMARLLNEWIQAKQLIAGDAVDLQLLRRLALVPEHTWGTDTKRYIDHEHYSPKELGEYISKPGYQTMERSWQEKRDDIDAGIANLPVALRSEARARLETLRVKLPESFGMKLAEGGEPFHTAHFEISLDSETGCINRLVDRKGRSWASPDHPLALFAYQTLTQEDYKAFLDAYVLSKQWWAPQDFGKPNIERFQAVSKSWNPKLVKLWLSETDNEHRLLAELEIHDPESESAGLVAWPKQMYLELQFPKTKPNLQITFYSIGKAPNRMPEAMWLTFAPNVSETARWMFQKVGQDISPTDVVRGGSTRMHAVTKRIACRDHARQLDLSTLDAPVVALGTKSPLNFSRELPDMKQGIHISLFNNAWGTNYPQWAGGDWKYRFILSV